MIKNKFGIVAGLCLMLALQAGCDSLLETEPQQSVSPDIALGTPQGLRAVYHGAYNRLNHVNYYGTNSVIAGDALADNSRRHPVPSGYFDCQHLNNCGIGGWGRYGQINDINLVIRHAPTAGLGDAERTRIVGEMHFLRALAYHDLVKVYAYEPNRIVGGWDRGVILRTEPSETVQVADQRLPRATVTEVYQQIEADLLEAIDLLASVDPRTRFYGNQAAAEALLARVYLYWGRWADAETYATRAMNTAEALGARLAAPGEVAGMFASSSDPNIEALFELRFRQSEGGNINTTMQSYLTPPGHYDVLPSAEFLATLEPGDVRNALYPLDTDLYAPPAAGGFRFVNKYPSAVATWTDNVPIIRYAEVLLTRAEARAHQPARQADALLDLNRLRQNRGLDPVLVMPGNLVDEILLERRRELAFEGNHRWHDMKRYGRDIVKPGGSFTVEYLSREMLSAIPQSQVDLNPNLEQNPGY
jgi:starch-binding outer membrane protein, SusD/RagB family